MENQTLQQLFVDILRDMYSCERQLVTFLPEVINAVSLKELKETIQKHLVETQNQVRRIEKIFSIIGCNATENTCEAMQGMVQETRELVKTFTRSPVLDAAIIAAAQKIEHYEIATYGTLKSFAKQLDFESEVVDLLQDSLDEEGAADKKLTKIAEGSFFSSGVNREAATSRR